jgi:mRNA-degrading endonuclease toxin of MazEF toxin-antitoxin module
VLRGDIYRFKLPKGVGHEQHGNRYGVVVQAKVKSSGVVYDDHHTNLVC